MSTRLFTTIALLIAAIGLTACDNTIRGAGRDIQDSANAVEDATN